MLLAISPYAVGLLVAVILATAIWCYLHQNGNKTRFQSETQWGEIEPVPPTFDWSMEDPDKYRPFKSIYHVTMNVTRTSRQDWMKIDSIYLKAMENHKRIMKEHPDTTCMVSGTPKTNIAVQEMYDLAVDTLTQRYPKYFVPEGNVVLNTITGNKIPRFSEIDSNPRELLRILAENAEEDIMVLEYDPTVEEYRLQASSGLAGLGFEWREKVGLKLTDIHEPVPQYKEKLQRSMNRYFHRITPGPFTQRITYGVMLGDVDDLYSSGNFSFDGEIDVEKLDFENSAFVRLERQVLFRLPVTGFLGFSIRTYMYSLAELKREGLGNTCADALEAWPEDTAHYKGRHIWGGPVLEYLRS